MEVLKNRDACYFCEECTRNNECFMCNWCTRINKLLKENEDLKIKKYLFKSQWESALEREKVLHNKLKEAKEMADLLHRHLKN